MSDLLDYATDYERPFVEAYIERGSYRGAASVMGCDFTTARKHIKRALARAALSGVSPEEDAKGLAPVGYHVKGKSTLYGDDGEKKLQWVKTIEDREAQTRILLERLESGSQNFKQFKPTQKPKRVDDDYLALLTITDFHLGMLAWGDETGADWDVSIARTVFLNSIHDMIEAAPACGTGILNQLGDFLHFDSLESVTPTSGHLLDSDSRYDKVVELSMEVMTEAVRMMLKKFGKVVVVQAEGNHDIAGSVWLRKHIKHLFANDERVEVIDNPFPFYAHLHGKTMLGFHHGHKVKMQGLPKLFASEPRFRAMWGEAERCYIHIGHLHHEWELEDGGAKVIRHPTLAARDAYATRGGYVSDRGAKMHVYHKEQGEITSHTVRPRA